VASANPKEEHILQCLRPALITQWNTSPIKLQKELFDSGGATMGELAQGSHRLDPPRWTSICRRRALREPYKLGRGNVDDANHSLPRKR
jgi:hypothetical protein